MIFGNYTCETHRGAHTPLMQTAVLQEKTLKFENVCVMIRIQLHTKLPLHQQHTKGNLNYFNQELHPEEFQPLITITPQCIKSIYIDIYMSVCIYIYMYIISWGIKDSCWI